MIRKNSKIFIAGHKGLVGSAIYRKLKEIGYTNLIIADRKKLDLTSQIGVIKFSLTASCTESIGKGRPALTIAALTPFFLCAWSRRLLGQTISLFESMRYI